MLRLQIIPEVTQEWAFARLIQEAVPETWEEVFQDAKNELNDLAVILEEQEKDCGIYYPLKEDIFAAFWLTPLPEVKVVIIGQDPYFQTVHVDGKVVPRAVGLSFSVRRGDEIPISLKNIYRVLSSTVEGFQTPNHGDLRAWATQGVLLANTSLTVRPDEPNSHEGIWLDFMKKVFKGIARVNPRCIYLLWGREAQRLRPLLGEKSIFLETSHPSGKSASRGFLDCNHFNLANKYLIEQGNKPINWNL